jgi:predicted Zn-dependent peptidase
VRLATKRSRYSDWDSPTDPIHSVLACGLTVLTWYYPHFPAVALSYTLTSGSRCETAGTNGIHHFSEHMILRQSHQLEKVAKGLQINGLTTKEITQFCLRTTDDMVNGAFEWLTAGVMDARFSAQAFEQEKRIIVREIDEKATHPDQCALESFYAHFFGDNPLGFPVTGRKECLMQWNLTGLVDFYHKRYVPGRLVLSAAGNIRHQEVMELAEFAFSHFPPGSRKDFSFESPILKGGRRWEYDKRFKNCHVLLGFKGVPLSSPRRYAFMVLDRILCGSRTSRLYRRIEELDDSVSMLGAFIDDFFDMNLYLIYAVVLPDKVQDYLEALASEISRLKEDGVTVQELRRAKDHARASLLLGLEDNFSRLKFMTNRHLYPGNTSSLKEMAAAIDAVSLADTNRLLLEYLAPEHTMQFLYGNTAAVPG